MLTNCINNILKRNSLRKLDTDEPAIRLRLTDSGNGAYGQRVCRNERRTKNANRSPPTNSLSVVKGHFSGIQTPSSKSCTHNPLESFDDPCLHSTASVEIIWPIMTLSIMCSNFCIGSRNNVAINIQSHVGLIEASRRFDLFIFSKELKFTGETRARTPNSTPTGLLAKTFKVAW